MPYISDNIVGNDTTATTDIHCFSYVSTCDNILDRLKRRSYDISALVKIYKKYFCGLLNFSAIYLQYLVGAYKNGVKIRDIRVAFKQFKCSQKGAL